VWSGKTCCPSIAYFGAKDNIGKGIETNTNEEK
jgi:hypothetical protein